MPESIELITPVLGLQPFILIEAKPVNAGEDGFSLDVRAGGGVGTQDELATLLLLVIEEVTGVPTDLYVTQIDTIRRAAGRTPLSDTTGEDTDRA